MLSLAAVMINLVLVLVKLPFFSSISRPLPEWHGRTGKRWALSAALSILPTVPLFIIIVYLAEQYLGISEATNFLPVGTTNRFILYFMTIGILELALFYFTFYKKEKLSLAECGLSWEHGSRGVNLINAGKSFLLAAIAVGSVLTFLFVMEVGFGMSFSAWFTLMRAVTLKRVLKSLIYLPIFFIPLLGMQFGSNISRRLKSTGRPTRDLVRDVLVNCLVSTGFLTLYFVFNMWCNDHNILWNVADDVGHTYYMYNYILLGNIASATTTVLYRKTGTVWPGVFTCTLLLGILLPGACPII